METLDLCAVIHFLEDKGYGFAQSITQPSQRYFFHISVFKRDRPNLTIPVNGHPKHRKVEIGSEFWCDIQPSQNRRNNEICKIYRHSELESDEILIKIQSLINKSDLITQLLIVKSLNKITRKSINLFRFPDINSSSSSEDIFKKILVFINSIPISLRKQYLRDRLPLKLQMHSQILPFFSSAEQYDLLIENFEVGELPCEYFSIAKKLIKLLPEYQLRLFRLIPKFSKIAQECYISLTELNKIILIIDSVKKTDSTDSLINRIYKPLQLMPEDQRDIASTILSPSWCLDDRLFTLFSVVKQADLIVKNLHKDQISDKWVSHIKRLLKSRASTRSFELFKLLPQNLQDQDEYFNLLDSNYQLELIKQKCYGNPDLSDYWYLRIKRLLPHHKDNYELFQLLPQSYQGYLD